MLALLVSFGLVCAAGQAEGKAAFPIYVKVPPRVAGLLTLTQKPAGGETLRHLHRILTRGPSLHDFMDVFPMRTGSAGPTWVAWHYRYASVLVGGDRHTRKVDEVTLILYRSGK